MPRTSWGTKVEKDAATTGATRVTFESIIEELLEKVIEAVTEVGEFILISGARNVKTFKISNPNLDSTKNGHINHVLLKVIEDQTFTSQLAWW